DKLGRVTLQINPDGAVTAYSYNAFGQQTQVARLATRYTGSLSTTVTPSVTYSGSDQLQGTAYDRLGQVTAITTWWGGLGTSEYYNEGYTYDAFGNVKTATARNGAVTTYTYDKLNRKVSETLPIQSRNDSNQLVAVVNTYAYDAAGNLVTRTEAAGLPEQRITSYTYDKHNRLLSEAGDTFQAYHPVTNSTVSVTPTKYHAYDARGNLVQETDANGHITWHTYDLNNQRTGTIAADGSYTRTTYDQTGNQVSEIRYANAVKTSGTAQLTAGTIPELLTAAPTAGSNKVYVLLDATQDRTVYVTYDKIGRETGTRIEDITTGTYNPDIAGGQYQVTTGDITTSKAYDANGNLVKSVDANGNVTRYYYNQAGEQVAKVDALGYLTTWTRDAFGNVTTETQYAQSVSTGASPLTMDDSTTLAAIQAKAVTLASHADNRITERTYDALNRVKTESRLNVQAGTINTSNGQVTPTTGSATTTYEYDGLNNVTKKTDATGAVTSWIYDGMGRRTAQVNPGFTDYEGTYVNPRTDLEYNGLNNIIREVVRGKDDNTETDDHITRYEYNQLGFLTAEIDATNARTEYGYDAHGNVTRTILQDRRTADQVVNNQVGVDDVTVLRYDALNRQVRTTDQGTGLISEIRYNGFGEVTGKRSYVGTPPVTSNPNDPVSGWQEFAQYDQAGRVWKSNSGDGVTKVYVYDKQGNTT
ncbi:hypothetical protein LG198_14340, partial [Methylobacillus arboreus]|uniref:hypothetical protein n=1 Tax=Methylobacillus arboreus TaxID=755170 RepID=UPI001E61024B